MNTEITVTTDSVGDTFVSGYNRYTSNGIMFKDHMEQFKKNYEEAFGEEPTPEALDSAFGFAYKILCEIWECYPTSHDAKYISRISHLFKDNAFDTIDNIAAMADNHPINRAYVNAVKRDVLSKLPTH